MAKEARSSGQYLIIAGIVALVIFAAIAIHFAKTPLLKSSELVAMKKGTLTSEIQEDIILMAVSNMDLSFENGGKIKNIFVDVGDSVKKGQLLAEVENADYISALNEAVARRNAAEALADAAHENVSIQKAKVHSLKNADAKKYDVKAQEETVDQAQAQEEAENALFVAAEEAVKGANIDLGKTKIFAPADGTIIRKPAEVGEIVSAAVPTPVLTLASNGNLQAEAEVSELDMKKISAGDSANISINSESQNAPNISAKVKNIYPAATINNGVSQYKIIFELENPREDLKAGLTGTANIQISQKNNVIQIPSSSIFSDGRDKYVMTLQNGILQRKEVEVGALGADGMVEIVGGLSEEDQIIKF